MSTFSTELRRSILSFNAAKRAALVALVLAPDSLPIRPLTELKVALMWLKRALLLQDALT